MIFGEGYDPSLMLMLNRVPSQNMANALTNKVSSAGSGVQSAMSKAQSDFLKAVTSGTLGYDPNVDEETALMRMGSGYTGPNSLYDLQSFDMDAFLEKAIEAERMANLLGSSGGIYELLQKQYGAPSVAPIDVAMAQNAGGKEFATIDDKYDDILDTFGDQLMAGEEKAWNAREASQAAANKYRSLYDQRVEQRMAQEQAAREAKLAQEQAAWQAAQQAAMARPSTPYSPPMMPQYQPSMQPGMPQPYQTPFQSAGKSAPKVSKSSPAPKKPAAKKPAAKKPLAKNIATPNLRPAFGSLIKSVTKKKKPIAKAIAKPPLVGPGFL